MKFFATVVSILLIAFGAAAKMTNDPVEAMAQGRELVRQILEQRPAENFTNTGVLIIDDGHGRSPKVPIKFEVSVNATNWLSVYEAYFSNRTESLKIIHQASQPFRQFRDSPDAHSVSQDGVPGESPGIIGKTDEGIEPSDVYEHAGFLATNMVSARAQSASFAGSDFSVSDLRLEFLHWPDQKILKPYEMRRGRSCKVLESINPNPSPGAYSRVVSWIDNETLGIVQAEAYDVKGKLLKEFYPKDFKKVNGQWEVGEMEMINDETGSRSWIKFNLNQRR